jgi:dynein heavy chain 2
MQHFVNEAFGGQQVQPAPFALRNLYESESSCREPVLFIITPGSDPSTELQEFAETVVGRQCFHELAMGGGQNDVAIELVKKAAEKGEWVCLKNLHLVTSWLPSLEKEIKLLNPDKKFRLWLTSEPHAKFPSILLQSSLKITYETPPGVRNNLMRTFSYVTPSPEQQKANPAMTQLLFVLSWFHALIQERRKYIPQGWSKYYEFSLGDLKAGELTLSAVQAESKGSPQWQKVFGILENAIYGGRIDNSFDLRVLRAYIAQMFRDSVLRGQESLSNIVAVPQSGNARDYTGLIAKVPESDTPALFGLPANIDRSVQRFNSNAVIAALKQLAAVSAEELRFDKQKWTQKLGPLCQLWAGLYKRDTFEKLQLTQDHLNSPDPVEAFVYMEVRNV